MLLRTHGLDAIKPPPGARIDFTHPLGRTCQAACLFNDGIQGAVAKVPGTGPFGTTYLDTPWVEYGQTLGLRVPRFFGSTAPVWTINTAGRAVYFGSNFSGMDIGFHEVAESYDLDYPQNAINTAVTHGETICVIRRKTDTTLRPATLFGVEGSGFGLFGDLERCGAHVPYSDGNVYWDYGNSGGANRLIIGGLSFSTNVERWIFHAGPRGSAVWRNGIKVGSQATAITRQCVPATLNYSAWVLNGGNGLGTSGSGDLQEISFIMYLASQWPDTLCQWWSAEPYAAFLTTERSKRYFFLGSFPVLDPAAMVQPQHAQLLPKRWTRVAY